MRHFISKVLFLQIFLIVGSAFAANLEPLVHIPNFPGAKSDFKAAGFTIVPGTEEGVYGPSYAKEFAVPSKELKATVTCRWAFGYTCETVLRSKQSTTEVHVGLPYIIRDKRRDLIVLGGVGENQAGKKLKLSIFSPTLDPLCSFIGPDMAFLSVPLESLSIEVKWPSSNSCVVSVEKGSSKKGLPIKSPQSSGE